MTAPVETYSRRGFLAVLATAAVMSAVGGGMAYLTGAETITCSRASERRIDCTFRRMLLRRFPLYTTTLTGIEAPSVSSHQEGGGIGRRKVESGPAVRLQFLGEGDRTHSAAQSAGAELREIESRIRTMLREPSVDRVEATVTGSPRAHKWSSALLITGVALVPLWLLGLIFPSLRGRQRSYP